MNTTPNTNYFELNLDGLVGPTHHYAGLAFGNIASMASQSKYSNPKKAALEGLEKMKYLHDLGIKQAIMPPHPRPNLCFLSSLGFKGKPPELLHQVVQTEPKLLSAAFSASNMWTANCATVTPSIDNINNKLQFTPANLCMHLHRHQELKYTSWLLKQIFSDSNHFEHHPHLPLTTGFNDEGAANHNRLASSHAQPGFHVFVYGQSPQSYELPSQFPARQSLIASQAVARQHGLKSHQVMFLQQSPHAIDAGVFHNDVISLANEQVFLIHEDAFCEQPEALRNLQAQLDFSLQVIEVPKDKVSLEDAVHSYLFNAQLITKPGTREMFLVAPYECHENPNVAHYISDLIQDDTNPINDAYFVHVKQSMRNGGGPACLRLRIPMNEAELSAMHQGVLMTNNLYHELKSIIQKYYREALSFDDLTSLNFYHEVQYCYQAIYALLNLQYLEA